ncbi:MAG: uracil-DNA glycosylase [Flavobacteriales bacterium]|nr:uracil-DNA glycosylase [Flavobacteriales bacterium]
MEIDINSDWSNLLAKTYKKKYFLNLLKFLEVEYSKNRLTTFPDQKLLFNALNSCSLNDVKVVILGQDPYPTRGHANGLSFSVNENVSPLPKSLKNIFKELSSDLLMPERTNGNLEDWANQGVLLLNNVMSVREGEAGSHFNNGWEEFTSDVIEIINEQLDGVVFILWGTKAQIKAVGVNLDKHLIIKSSHPSPLSSYRGFFGSKPFSRTNDFLKSVGKQPIIW